eukprot:5019983-Amphidinium_carterae.1
MVPDQQLVRTLVLYTTKRPPKAADCTTLVRLGFPLPESHLPPVTSQVPLGLEPVHCEEEEEFTFEVVVGRVDMKGAPAHRSTAVEVMVMVGADIGDLREAVRKRLKIHPKKL